jgi:hypothetical protein
MKIYRKPTYTDSIIPNDSCHPREHKQAAIWDHYNRLNEYQLPPDKTQKEINLIKQILRNNGYDNPIQQPTFNSQEKKPNTEKRRWSRFTYTGIETRAISKVFQNTAIGITYSTKKHTKKLLTKKRHPHKNKYDYSGIYQITCPT